MFPPLRVLISLAALIATGPSRALAQGPLPTATAPSAPAVQTSTIPSDQNYRPKLAYQVYFNDYLALKKGKPVELIFIGDSITEQWRWGPGFPVWKKHFEDRALNFGLGADRTQHTLWRLQNTDLSGWSPKVAVLLLGTNNTADTPADIAAGVSAVMREIHGKFAGIKIVVLSILPNARATEKMASANLLIAELADKKTIYYLDLASKFPPNGDNWSGLLRDKLHLSTEGYEVWARELETFLREIQ